MYFGYTSPSYNYSQIFRHNYHYLDLHLVCLQNKTSSGLFFAAASDSACILTNNNIISNNNYNNNNSNNNNRDNNTNSNKNNKTAIIIIIIMIIEIIIIILIIIIIIITFNNENISNNDNNSNNNDNNNINTNNNNNNIVTIIIIAKLDFNNAINCLRRDVMLSAVAENTPNIYRFCHIAYDKPTHLKFFSHMILSQKGAHQGDPLGSLVFCLLIHSLFLSYKSHLKILIWTI